MFNQFTGIGRLAADPETRYSQAGKAIANFTICCDSGYGEHKKTEFVRCVAFDKLAEIIKDYLGKGSLCMVQGALQTRKWQDKDGADRYTTEIVAREMKILSPKQEASQGGGESKPFDASDDVPF